MNRHSKQFLNPDLFTYQVNWYDELDIQLEKEKNEKNNFDIIKMRVASYFEGRKLQAYKDTVGKWTIGIGKNFDDVDFLKSEEEMIRKRLNIYTGNIKNIVIDNGISNEECDYLYANSAKIAKKDAKSLIPNFEELSEARQIALIDFSFNVGYNVMKSFKNTRRYIENGEFEKASQGFKNSLWYKQVGRRGPIICSIIKTGEFSEQFAKSAKFLELL